MQGPDIKYLCSQIALQITTQSSKSQIKSDFKFKHITLHLRKNKASSIPTNQLYICKLDSSLFIQKKVSIGMVWNDAALNWGSKGELRGTGCLQQAVRFTPGWEPSYINLIDIALK